LQRDCGIKIVNLDKYNNLIADVLLQKGNLVHFLLSQGYAKLCKPTFNINENQLINLEELQRNAQESGRGIWKNDTVGNKI
jgi:endonuclease YncB( thermonuclease family)